MDGHPEGSLAVDNYARRWTGEDTHGQRQGMSFG